MIKEEDPLTYQIIGIAYYVKRVAGPGLWEAAYDKCLCIALRNRGFKVRPQAPLFLEFEGERLMGYRCDLIVNDEVIVEVKCVDAIVDEHKRQVLNYLHLAKLERGLILNFQEPKLVNGIRRVSTKAHILSKLMKHERESIIDDFANESGN